MNERGKWSEHLAEAHAAGWRFGFALGVLVGGLSAGAIMYLVLRG